MKQFLAIMFTLVSAVSFADENYMALHLRDAAWDCGTKILGWRLECVDNMIALVDNLMSEASAQNDQIQLSQYRRELEEIRADVRNEQKFFRVIMTDILVQISSGVFGGFLASRLGWPKKLCIPAGILTACLAAGRYFQWLYIDEIGIPIADSGKKLKHFYRIRDEER